MKTTVGHKWLSGLRNAVGPFYFITRFSGIKHKSIQQLVSRHLFTLDPGCGEFVLQLLLPWFPKQINNSYVTSPINNWWRSVEMFYPEKKKPQPATKADKMYQGNSEFLLSCFSKRKGIGFFFKNRIPIVSSKYGLSEILNPSIRSLEIKCFASCYS